MGAIRPAKFVKYLSRLGWQPVVLTIRTKYLPAAELAREEDVRGVPVWRTAVWPTPADALVRLRTLIGRRPAHRADSSSVASRETRAADGLWRAFRTLLHFSSEFPDNEVGWVLPAIWRGFRLIRRERIRVLMVSAPPRSSVIVGLVLARLTGVRLITDLRDPWMPHDATGSESTWSGTVRAKAWLERRLVAGSDEIITTADRYTSFLQARHPRIPPSRFHTITNGYDEDDFAELGAIPSDPAFTLSYLGTFYWKRTPRPLLAALSRLVRRGAIPRDLLRLKFIGTVARAEGEAVSDLVREFDLEGCVSVRGVIPYHDALVEMRRAAVLVLMAPEAQFYGIPAKTFEYIGSRRPILCLGHRGATADVVRRAGAGLVVDPQDVSAIAAAIERLFCTWRAGQTVISADDRSRFARSRLTRSLVDVLERRA